MAGLLWQSTKWLDYMAGLLWPSTKTTECTKFTAASTTYRTANAVVDTRACTRATATGGTGQDYGRSTTCGG